MTEKPAEVMEDLSAWVGAGRVYSADQEPGTSGRSVRQSIADVVEAERLGFRRAILSERFNLKEASSFLGVAAGRTTRIDVGTGVMALRARHPLLTAAFGATMQAAVGERLVLGLGKSYPTWINDGEARDVSYREVIDTVSIIRGLWAGESVTYRGPAGTFTNMRLGDVYDGAPPQVWYGTIGNPLGAKAAANPVFDGAMLWPCMTPEAVHKAVTRLREACELQDRDPSSLRIMAPVVTAPDLSDYETRAVCHARLVTYATWPHAGQIFANINGWAIEPFEEIAEHAMFQRMPDVSPDLSFHREQMMEPASLVPDAWIQASCAVGSVSECVAKLREFREAGVDEIATYGSTPSQNAALADAWRSR